MSTPQSEPIAVVGSACCFPGGADSPAALWNLLKNPRDVAKDIPDERFHVDGFYHPDGAHHGSTNVRQAYLVDRDIRLFDSTFFNISPNEADSMDPQHRLLLETVFEALESGGHQIESLRGSDTSVYTGTMNVDYHDTWTRDPDTTPRYLATGVNRAIISNRISYFFDWHGPSMTIDTACSSSLVAVHQAVQSLRSGESQMSLACGTQVILNPEAFIMESKLKMLSPTSRSRMWDADADGYARGEGIAAVVLKRLSDAIANGDHIECLIRATGSNQDGYSNGITVPSTDAQASLIRATYAKAGLNPEENPADRPQYFEAHGTGTKAGDPKEAAAIARVFGQSTGEVTTPLYVGSVKTVIGHLEGAAGLAGLLKAANMVSKGTIVPNLLFQRLNPDIEPFYQSLQVPTKQIPWPELAKGVPRRVSVNSFGFGGTNAHAIVEEYRGASVHTVAQIEPHAMTAQIPTTPFMFSAASDASLSALLQAYSDHLADHPDIKPSDLAWTLQARRSEFSTKTSLSASTIPQLQAKIAAKLEESKRNPNAVLGVRAKSSSHAKPGILGVFTGQGAQWPAMGAQLIKTSEFVRKRVQDLQESLATLPAKDQPTWKLEEEMLADESVSRVSEAELSQPLCTAVQIILVDLLRAANIHFSAVVGHSSGEIAAAYAAGLVNASDAIRIAYYRGLIVQQAPRGAMLAVGTSIEDAKELAALRAFRGRLGVAAHNSSASVTISGDIDAVVHAKKVFDEEKKFARLLKVEKAYHSHHMLPCGDAYIDALRGCNIGMAFDKQSNFPCNWFSSVHPSSTPMQDSASIRDTYWRDNLASPVLFADAIRNAIVSDEQIGLVVEVGPHPALKGPAMQTISDERSGPLPYCGTLSRGSADTEAFADGLGFLWQHLSSREVDFPNLTSTLLGRDAPEPQLVVGLPSYPWNHTRPHWSEPRRSRRILARQHAAHEILGTQTPDSNAHDRRWTNVLKASEIPWLNGHKLQGQTVFPAAGYVAMAIEASRTLNAPNTSMKVFELRDLTIPKAIPFDDADTLGVEVLVTLTELHRQGSSATATFSCYALPVTSAGLDKEMDLVATGTVAISFGNPSEDALPELAQDDHSMFRTDSERFYSSLEELGYGYTGPFRALHDIKRKLNHATGSIASYPYTVADLSTYLIHPSTLDTAFQLAMAACSAPGDGQLWSLHVPTYIASISVNPAICERMPPAGGPVPSYAAVEPSPTGFTASIDLLSQDSEHCMVRIEDLVIQPFAPATKADDRMTYTFTKFDLAAPDAISVAEGVQPQAAEVATFSAAERIAFYYHRKWQSEITDAEWSNGPPHQLLLRNWVNDTVARTSAGQHPALKKEWAQDTEQDIQALARQHWDHVVVRIVTAVGENMAASIRGETTILEHMTEGGMLTEYYEKGAGISTYHGFLRDIMKQIIHRNPRSKIIEIGAGTGGATAPVLDAAGPTMSSYTYTDISPAFFETATKTFTTHGDKMAYRVLDIEKDPANQGYEPHSYDVVIAFNVLHATRSLQETLANTRKLLKHGGYLVLMEFTNNNAIRVGTTMAGLSGWWLGADDNRPFAPTVTTREWNSVLRKSGFGGVDTATPDIDNISWPLSIMVSQAVDERVQFLRRPLTTPGRAPVHIESLVILGADTLQGSQIAEELCENLARFCDDITVLDGLPTEKEAQTLKPLSTFINLADLGEPIFKDMSEEKMKALQRMFSAAHHVLWVTNGALAEQPYHMASIVFSRTVRREETHIGLNHLDISDLARPDTSKAIAQHLLQTVALDEWENDKQFLWSKETEVFLDNNNKSRLPRMLPDPDRNPRLNATRRNVSKMISASDPSANAAIVQRSAHSSHDVVDVLNDGNNKREDGHGGLFSVKSSSLMALRIQRDAFLYLSAMESKPGDRKLMLSATNSLKIAPIVTSDITTNDINSNMSIDHMVVAATAEILADSLSQDIPPGARLLLHCSTQDLLTVSALRRRAKAKDAHFIVCGAEVVGEKNSRDLTFVDLTGRTSQHSMRRALNMLRPTHYLDLTACIGEQPPDVAGLSSDIARNIPSGCRIVDTVDHIHHQSSLPATLDELQLSRYLDAVVATSLHTTAFDGMKMPPSLVMPLRLLRQAKSPRYATSVVSWPSEGHVEITVPPLDPGILFSQDKTYLLTGLAGDIGRSLCEYMVSHGAGCVILTSRRPQVDERWLASIRESGAKVEILALDVTDRSGAERVVKNIRERFPPIAGVAHGANVLSDVLFSRTSINEMTRTLSPKIDGANTLDEIFRDDDLDFFVLFSSISSLAGNIGQSAYVAGNGYLNGLARQRRRRGKAASAFDIGRVVGLGVIETVGKSVVDQLLALGLPPLNETELRQAFAETILAGYPTASDQEDVPRAVITATLRNFHDSEEEELKGPWFESTLFSHLVHPDDNAGTGEQSAGQGQDSRTALRVGEQLAQATSTEEAREILQQCFTAKLRVILQMMDDALDVNVSVVELGIDSLVAVEIRSWFLKELKVDIPVLKVVGGASVAELCETALEKLPEGLLGSLGKEALKPTKPTKAEPHPLLASLQAKNSQQEGASSEASSLSTSDSESTQARTAKAQVSESSRAVSSPSSVSSTPPPSHAELPKGVPISFAQSRYWFLNQLLKDPRTSNVAAYYHIQGRLRIEDLERATRIVLARHEALRTRFVQADSDGGVEGTPDALQVLLPRSLTQLKCEKAENKDEVEARFSELREHRFDLASGDLLQMVLLTLSPSSHYLLVHHHHIIMDGVSVQVVLADLAKAYNYQSLGPLPRQYPEFSLAQRQEYDAGNMAKELQYWRGIFPAGKQPPILPLLPMAHTSSRIAMNAFDTHEVRCIVEADVAAKIRQAARKQASTAFHFYLAAFHTMLFRFTDVEELVVGMADAARNAGDLQNSVGFFLNLLPLKFRRSMNQRFSETISVARKTSHAALETSRLPFDVLLTELGVGRSSSHSPLFQAFIDYRQGSQEGEQSWADCKLVMQDSTLGKTAYDVTIDVTDTASHALVTMRVQKSLYDNAAASLLLEAYVDLLHTFASDTSQSLSDPPMFSERQLTKALHVGRGPNLVSDWPETLVHRIDQVAEQFPEETALMDGLGNMLSYSGMLKRVHAIAEKLEHAHVGDGDRVLVYQQAAADWACSMLAILRIGAVYVPVDFRGPLARKAAVVTECQPTAILCDLTTINDVVQLNAPPQAHIINLSEVASAPRLASHISNRAKADSLATIQYTSGSTGTPKGISIMHSGLRNEIEGYTKTWKLGAERVLQQSAFTFDFATDELYTGLVNGGVVYIVSDSMRGDPLAITQIIKQQNITYTRATPSEYLLWLQYGRQNLRQAAEWRHAFAGGETLTSSVTREFVALDHPLLRLYNSYGPAETSVSSCKIQVDYRDPLQDGSLSRIPCGYSLPNYQTYIIDGNLSPLPVGMPGEVSIAGAGVSMGYRNNEDLTKSQFVHNPFATQDDKSQGWTNMYRTGDIGHLNEDGALVFRGRVDGDTQVKIRGLRIDLADIEANIFKAAEGALREVVVTLYEGDPNFLVGRVVFGKSIPEPEAFLQKLLSQLPLPQYMVPVALLPVDSLPLTSHSKVDRKAVKGMLLPRKSPSTTAQDDGTLTETMSQLRGIWQDIVGSKIQELGLKIGPSTDFFHIGGNSLLMIRLQSRIQRGFHVAIPLMKLLGQSTLAGMAGMIEDAAKVAEAVDWDLETAPPSLPDFLADVTKQKVEQSGSQTILVTGGTGFLARHLLPLLAENPSVNSIHCVAVRKNAAGQPRSLLPSSTKIIWHEGDLTSPLLGLSEDTFRTLATQADSIIHLGATRSVWDNYHTLRATNVHPTRELVKLAASRCTPIHFISTIGASLGPASSTNIAAATPTPSDNGRTTNGYVASKWASERVLARAAETFGIPSTTLRFQPVSNLDSPSAAPEPLMQELRSFVDTIGSVPDPSGWAGQLHMTPVGHVAQKLCSAVLTGGGERERREDGGASVEHWPCEITLSGDEITTLVSDANEKKLEKLPMLKWFGRIKKLGFGYFIASHEASVGAGADRLVSKR